jgi:hypothetical protein
MSTVPPICGTYRLSQIQQYWQTDLIEKRRQTRLLIDITTPEESNVNTKETEQLNKCKDLEIEASRMWKVRTEIVPVTIGALGTMKKGLDQNPHSFPAQPSAIEVQKITLMSTAHCICKVWGESLRSVEIWACRETAAT